MKKAIVKIILFSSALLSFSCVTTEKKTKTEETTEKPTEIAEIPASPAEQEYLRSVHNIAITHETFNKDKADIMQTIKRLASIMQANDYKKWLTCIDRDSINYWSDKRNLYRASKLLPMKGLQMNSLQDYFTYVFIPARKNRSVNEIRYDSETEVKAVQTEKNIDVIYYNFKKIGDEWKVKIPPIQTN